MTEDFLTNYPNFENFIPGIYNYCDRWCERCPFTDRCMNYAMEKRRWGDNPPRDIQGYRNFAYPRPFAAAAEANRSPLPQRPSVHPARIRRGVGSRERAIRMQSWLS